MKDNYIVFTLQGDTCALNVGDVQYIAELGSMVRTNNKKINVMEYENKALPVVDPVAMLSFDQHEPTTKSRIIVMKKNGVDFGVLVQEVVGAIEIEEELIKDPDLSENLYVLGQAGKVKIFNPSAFLTNEMVSHFNKVYMIPIMDLEAGQRVHRAKGENRNELLDEVRLRALNFLVDATKKKMENKFIVRMMEIHDLVAKL